MKQSQTTGANYDANNAKVAIVCARFNGDIVQAMYEAAQQTLLDNGMTEKNIKVIHVPGAFELPLASKALAQSKKYSSVIALGCVIRGDTPHFDYVCNSAAMGIQHASLETNIPIAFGVLTTDTAEQALQRSSSSKLEDNKGRDAALCALEMMNVLKSL